MRQLLTVPLMLLMTSAAAEEDHKYLKAFPPAADGMIRYVIQLPHKDRGEENGFRVEIIAGQEMLTDGVNLVQLGRNIEAKPLQGWGFTYYEVAAFGPAASTLMAVPPGTPKVKNLVSTSVTIPYNSRIPLVVYVPEGGEVHYRIWKASETTERAKEG